MCDLYDLLPAENYKLPPEAEGLEAPSLELETEKSQPQILKPPSQQRGVMSEEDNIQAVSRTNTRRHIRSSPSTGSAVTTVMEADEDENETVARKLKEMHLSAPETVEEESDVAEVPVIVERPVLPEESPQEPPPQDASMDHEDDESDADETVVEMVSEDEAEKDGVADAVPDTQEPVTSVEALDEPGTSSDAKDDVASKTTPEAPDAAAHETAMAVSTDEPSSPTKELAVPEAASTVEEKPSTAEEPNKGGN